MYKAGDCFVIEIGKVIEDGAGYLTNANIIVNDDFFNNLDRLDGDYINEHYGHLQDEAYNKGLEGGWNAAKKICSGMRTKTYGELQKIFGIAHVCSTSAVLDILTVQEALAKLEAYEKAQEEIKVGDVVKSKAKDYFLLIVLEIQNDVFTGFDGKEIYRCMLLDRFKKTNKNIDISSILEQVGGVDA